MDNVFAQNLRYLRQEKGLTQSQLAEILHYTQSNICEWEKGSVEPKAEALIAISNYFNVSADYLLGLEDELGVLYNTPASESALSEEERQIILQYRELNSACKKLIKDNMKMLATSTMANETMKNSSKS